MRSELPRLLKSCSGIARAIAATITIFLSATSTFAAEQSTSKIIDLTHPFNADTIYWPTENGFKLLRGPAGVTDRGYFYSANRFTSAEHGGTHIDAPIHFWEGGQTIDEIPLTSLIGSGACVDVAEKCRIDRDYQVSVEDFERWEGDNDSSLKNRIVLIRTGYNQFWPDSGKYLGTEETGRAAVAKLHFPGLDPSAADWLVTRRDIRLVGIDTASIDYGQSQDFATHVRLFRDNVPALENVANMGALPPQGFEVVALPMKIGGGSGAPCRVMAVLGD